MLKPSPTILNAFTSPAFVLEPGHLGEPVFASCNRMWFETVEQAPSEVYGRTIAEVFKGAPGQGALIYHRKAMAATEPITYRVTLPLKGRMCKLRSTLTPVRDVEGDLVCLIGTSVDVSLEEHVQALEMQFSALSQEIDSFTRFLTGDLLGHVHRVREVVADLTDGFVDLGDGKLQLLEQTVEYAGAAEDMVARVVEHARHKRLAAKTDTFVIGAAFRAELEAMQVGRTHHVVSDGAVVMADKDVFHMILRNLVIGVGLAEVSEATSLRITASADSPGMISISIAAETGLLTFAVAAFEDPGSLTGVRADALTALQDMTRNRGGDYFAESGPEGDVVHFSLPGYMSDRQDADFTAA